MKQRPILFSGDMVRALLDGRKTMTRRVVKYPVKCPTHHISIADGAPPDRWCPYGQIGDVLWVREGFLQCSKMDSSNQFELDENGDYIPMVMYRATDQDVNYFDGTSDFPVENKPWKPSIHMPKSACRIWLEITDIRVERLQDITEDDAVKEGVRSLTFGPHFLWHDYFGGTYLDWATDSFQTLWQKINGPDSWEANPWVWVIAFKRIEIRGY